jgi:DNA repair protein RecO (recombination protein O)
MLHKTKAIILHHIKHTDNSLLLHAYTQELGRTTYVVNGIKSKRCVLKPAFLSPLSILDLDVEHNPKKEIHRIKESKPAYSFQNIPFDPIKNSIAFLLAEVLMCCLKESDKNNSLFDFLVDSILFLDAEKQGTANFHLLFLVKLSLFLGFYPNDEKAEREFYFDLINGCFVSDKPLHTQFLPLSESEKFYELLQKDFSDMHSLRYSREQRNNMLDNLIKYYELHLTGFSRMKSIDVLKTLFR